MEHLRQHERVTNADRLVQECVQQFHLAGEPKVTHFITAELLSGVRFSAGAV